MVGPLSGVPNYHQLTIKNNLADKRSPDAGANLNTTLVVIYTKRIYQSKLIDH